MSEPFGDMIREVDAFLVGKSKVHRTLERVSSALREAGVDFAVAGALAVGERGHLRLTVDVELEYPGDGRPKAVCFPDPARVAPGSSGLRILDLRSLIELKLASGTTAPDRLQDLADVVALIRANALLADFAASLDLSVREKYTELWQIAQAPPRDL